MKCLSLLAGLLLVVPCLYAEEKFTSPDFKFTATFPGKVDAVVERQPFGLAGTFQAVDEKNNCVVMVIANDIPLLGQSLAAGTTTQQEILTQNFEGIVKQSSVVEGSIVQRWNKWDQFDCLDYSYASNVAEHGAVAFIAGRAIFVVDTFYYIQIASPERGKPQIEALRNLVKSFSLQPR